VSLIGKKPKEQLKLKVLWRVSSDRTVLWQINTP
jgi:hypothetical protein